MKSEEIKKQLRQVDSNPSRIAREMGLSQTSVYRVVSHDTFGRSRRIAEAVAKKIKIKIYDVFPEYKSKK